MSVHEFVLARGQRVTVAAISINDKLLVGDFLEEINRVERNKVLNLFKKASDCHPISNPEKFKKVREGNITDIYELKPTDQLRVFCFQRGKTLLLTHGYRKKRDKTDKEEIYRAARIRDSYDKEFAK